MQFSLMISDSKIMKCICCNTQIMHAVIVLKIKHVIFMCKTFALKYIIIAVVKTLQDIS